MQESWKDVSGYEGLYQVSNTGKVRSLNFGRGMGRGGSAKERSLVPSPDGYQRVILRKNGIRKSHFVHRLVAVAFVPVVDGKTIVNHKDGNRSNNRADNLEWCDQQYNATYANAVQKRSRAVQMIDPATGEVLRTYYGVREAARETGIHYPNIIHACGNSSRTSGGYKWKYLMEE